MFFEDNNNNVKATITVILIKKQTVFPFLPHENFQSFSTRRENGYKKNNNDRVGELSGVQLRAKPSSYEPKRFSPNDVHEFFKSKKL